MSSSAQNEQLLSILAIGHEASIRGSGLSLEEALRSAKYSEHRSTFEVGDLVSVLESNPELLNQWVLYSEDKRTTGGWYVLAEKREIGQVNDSKSVRDFSTLEEAVANFVISELDFWAGTNAA